MALIKTFFYISWSSLFWILILTRGLGSCKDKDYQEIIKSYYWKILRKVNYSSTPISLSTLGSPKISILTKESSMTSRSFSQKDLETRLPVRSTWVLFHLGYTTHLMKRIQKGPVRGISLKLQEEVCSFAFNLFLLI